MASWGEIAKDAPDFAARVRKRFEMGINKTLATVRRDGSPRISAIEADFGDEDLTMGMMAGSMKLSGVRRDPRVALHSPTIDAPENDPDWPGDAKLAGTLIQTGPTAGPEGTLFRVDITEMALTYVGTPADHLVIETWHPGHGWRQQRRA
jgi:Pyridoxamine 5'-phosphate oxidase